jgi:hypothetical protein
MFFNSVGNRQAASRNPACTSERDSKKLGLSQGFWPLEAVVDASRRLTGRGRNGTPRASGVVDLQSITHLSEAFATWSPPEVGVGFRAINRRSSHIRSARRVVEGVWKTTGQRPQSRSRLEGCARIGRAGERSKTVPMLR